MLLHPAVRTHDAAGDSLMDGHETELRERIAKLRAVGNHAGADAMRRRLRGFIHGKGNMQIHYALKAPPRWKKAELSKVALLHLTPGLDGVSRAANEAERGLLPAKPTICKAYPLQSQRRSRPTSTV